MLFLENLMDWSFVLSLREAAARDDSGGLCHAGDIAILTEWRADQCVAKMPGAAREHTNNRAWQFTTLKLICTPSP